MSRLKPLIPVVISAVVGAGIALAVSGGSTATHTTTVYGSASPAPRGIPTSFSNTGKALDINQIYRQDSPGVVDIQVVSQTTTALGAQQSAGEGSGVVYDKNGYILTDEHVVSGANQPGGSVTVQFQDGLSAKATVVGTDPSTDVAVIHVNVPASQLHPIPFADSSAAQVGDAVVAIGSPFSLPETTTQGIVSAVARSIRAPNNYTITGAIQTDAAINPGNSGGPLLDSQGKVLGLSDQIETNNQTVTGQGSSSGVGFAVPSNTAARIANAIIAGHPIKHAYVGVDLNAASTGGAQVSQIAAGSPGQLGGLQPYDLVTAINGHAISSTEQFIETVDRFSPGQKITLTVTRGGQTQQLHITLGLRPATAPGG
ncbi:MAG: S1C family serine protease [Solirubrobacteraceae bacterium]